jgi:hypothetical protein
LYQALMKAAIVRACPHARCVELSDRQRGPNGTARAAAPWPAATSDTTALGAVTERSGVTGFRQHDTVPTACQRQFTEFAVRVKGNQDFRAVIIAAGAAGFAIHCYKRS